MRTRMIATGAVVLASLMLAGCSGASTTAEPSAEPKATTDAASAPSESTEATSDCPKLEAGVTVEAAVLAVCLDEALAATAGYASTSDAMGMQVQGKFNPAEKESEITFSMGSIISIGDKAWVQAPGAEWVTADSASSDATVAGLSTAAESLAGMQISSAVEGTTGTFTVTGEDNLLGEKVYVLTGELVASGITSAATYSLTSDWAPLASTSKATVSGTEVTTTMTVTEWDKKQDISAPK